MTSHVLIPDTQIRPGVPLSHLTAIGNYIVNKQPETVVMLGDFFDMHSLSVYDKGTKKAEGANYLADIQAGQKGMDTLLKPLHKYNKKRKKFKEKQYKPRLVFLLGNHENRIARHINANPELDGILGFHTLGLEAYGWEVIDFLKPIEIDGLTYAHYFYQPMTGRAYGGKAPSKLNNVGFSFVQGHVQGLDMAMKHLANGKTLRALIAGSFYQHTEEYKGHQANDHWHGCLMLNEVKDGNYCLLELSLEYLMLKWLNR